MDISEFVNEYNRSIEEALAKKVSKNDNLRLCFMNVEEPYTDGKNIVINPELDGAYENEVVLCQLEEAMGLNKFFSNNPERAMKLVTRTQTINMSLRATYSMNPPKYEYSSRYKKRSYRLVMKAICEILEDAYIEAIGVTLYKDFDKYFKAWRYLEYYLGIDPQIKIQRQLVIEDLVTSKVYEYLVMMRKFLLYPMDEEEPNEDLLELFKKTKYLFLSGSVCSSASKRWLYAEYIFDAIKELIPDVEDESSVKFEKQYAHDLPERLYRDEDGGEPAEGKTTSDNPKDENLEGIDSENQRDTEAIEEKGEKSETEDSKTLEGKPEMRLFHNLDGTCLEDVQYDVEAFFSEDKDIIREIEDYDYQRESAKQYDETGYNRGIDIVVRKRKSFTSGRDEYIRIKRRYRTIINTYRNKISEILQAPSEAIEYKMRIGTGIDSKRLIDYKKRFWYKKETQMTIPEISLLFMVDCSGSMAGRRLDAVKKSLVIMNEVLKGQGIDYAVFTHQAVYGIPEVELEIVMDFNGNEKDKYRLIGMQAYEGSRDGITLLWAEKYLQNNSRFQNKVIIVLSDGLPDHTAPRNNYCPPYSCEDSANVASKVIKRGTKIVAVALEEGGFPCYEELKAIYPETIACDNLSYLPALLLGLISRQIHN